MLACLNHAGPESRGNVRTYFMRDMSVQSQIANNRSDDGNTARLPYAWSVLFNIILDIGQISAKLFFHCAFDKWAHQC